MVPSGAAKNERSTTRPSVVCVLSTQSTSHQTLFPGSTVWLLHNTTNCSRNIQSNHPTAHTWDEIRDIFLCKISVYPLLLICFMQYGIILTTYWGFSGKIKENIKAPCHWTLCWEFTGNGEFPAQRASNAENVSIWWCQHDHLVKKTTVLAITDKNNCFPTANKSYMPTFYFSV